MSSVQDSDQANRAGRAWHTLLSQVPKVRYTSLSFRALSSEEFLRDHMQFIDVAIPRYARNDTKNATQITIPTLLASHSK